VPDPTNIVPRVTANEGKATTAGLDTDIVIRLVRARINELRDCYGIALQKKANSAVLRR
jgi:hypothetical protein